MRWQKTLRRLADAEIACDAAIDFFLFVWKWEPCSRKLKNRKNNNESVEEGGGQGMWRDAKENH